MSRQKRNASSRWIRDPQRESYWRAIVTKWKVSGKSVRLFCKEIGVSENSFYAWRRELQIRDRENLTKTLPETSDPSRIVLDSRGRRIPLSGKISEAPNEVKFVPLNIENAEKNKSPNTVGYAIEIRCPSGHVISVRSASELTLLQSVLHLLGTNKC